MKNRTKNIMMKKNDENSNDTVTFHQKKLAKILNVTGELHLKLFENQSQIWDKNMAENCHTLTYVT